MFNSMFYYDYEYGFRHYKFFSCIYESLILCQFDHTRPLFMQNSILKFQDRICLENILFVSKSLNNLSPSIFNTWFSFSSDQHNYETSSSTQGNLMKLFYKTNRYVKYSITVSAVEPWNKIYPPIKLKQLLLIFITHFIM